MKNSKFSTNTERMAHLRMLLSKPETFEEGRKLAWEWTTTKTFGKDDFYDLLNSYAVCVGCRPCEQS